jgi:hypothetical protein
MAAFDNGVAAAANDVTTIQIQRFDLADVKVLDAKGKKVEEADLARLLKKETFAMASLHGEPIDPLHLRVLKEGTLVFGLPAPKPAVGGPMNGIPAGGRGIMGGGNNVPGGIMGGGNLVPATKPGFPGQPNAPTGGRPGQ